MLYYTQGGHKGRLIWPTSQLLSSSVQNSKRAGGHYCISCTDICESIFSCMHQFRVLKRKVKKKTSEFWKKTESLFVYFLPFKKGRSMIPFPFYHNSYMKLLCQMQIINCQFKVSQFWLCNNRCGCLQVSGPLLVRIGKLLSFF